MVAMSCKVAKDIMHPRVSLPAKMAGHELIEKLMSPYPALSVVENKKLVGIISRKNIINALAEKGFWHEHEFKKRV